MNSRDLSAKPFENEFSEFLIKRIARAGGSIQLHHILSQVRNEIRDAIVTSKSDLIKFLKRHDNLFVVENNVLSLVKSSAFSTSGYDSDSNSTKSFSNLPSNINNGKGVIVKIFPNYGFIKSKEPIKSEIYFNSRCFGDRNIDLTSFLHLGAIVFFDAERDQSKCKYNAVKVWRNQTSADESNVITQKSRKNRETGLYDPINLESDGVIQKIFPNLGFISVKGDDHNTVFFHKNRVVNYDNIVDLMKVFSKGDRVEFTAHRSSKPGAQARWEATKVWKVSEKVEENNVSQPNISHLPLPKQLTSGLRTQVPEMIKDQRGKIYPRSNSAVIKFGNNLMEIADGDSAVYYVCGTQVTEIGWEFTAGDDIYFDAVKIKSAPGWKAVLVWTDKRPNIVLKTCLGDYSEFTEDDNCEISSSIYTSKSSLCMSENSNSSLNSERFSSKSKDSKKEKTRKLSDCFVSKEVKDTNKLSKYYKSSSRSSLNSLPVSDSYRFNGKKANDINKKLSKNRNSSSRDSLNSLPVSDCCYTSKKSIDTNKKLSKDYRIPSRNNLSSLTSSDKHYNLKSSEKLVKSDKCDNQLSKMVSNWGDSPYFVDEAYGSMEPSKSFQCDSETKHFTEDETENFYGEMENFSSSEYASAEEEKVDKNPEAESNEILFQNISSKTAASIKRHCNIKGNISKVFTRYAEVKSNILQNSVSFYLNDFYSDGKTVDELGVEDFKNILKVGDSINFNYFEIIDDFNQDWRKITLAWKGSKPTYSDEISPEDFINQNELSVTVNNEISDDEVLEKVNKRKFLTSYEDENADSINNLSKTESSSEDEEESLTSSSKSQAYSKTELPVDSESLLGTVYNILMRDVSPKDSMINIKNISEEIINIIHQSYTKKVNTLTSSVLQGAKCINDPLENVCSKCKDASSSSSSSLKTKNTAAQTIITGDIISQNILTDC